MSEENFVALLEAIKDNNPTNIKEIMRESPDLVNRVFDQSQPGMTNEVLAVLIEEFERKYNSQFKARYGIDLSNTLAIKLSGQEIETLEIKMEDKECLEDINNAIAQNSTLSSLVVSIDRRKGATLSVPRDKIQDFIAALDKVLSEPLERQKRKIPEKLSEKSAQPEPKAEPRVPAHRPPAPLPVQSQKEFSALDKIFSALLKDQDNEALKKDFQEEFFRVNEELVENLKAAITAFVANPQDSESQKKLKQNLAEMVKKVHALQGIEGNIVISGDDIAFISSVIFEKMIDAVALNIGHVDDLDRLVNSWQKTTVGEFTDEDLEEVDSDGWEPLSASESDQESSEKEQDKKTSLLVLVGFAGNYLVEAARNHFPLSVEQEKARKEFNDNLLDITKKIDALRNTDGKLPPENDGRLKSLRAKKNVLFELKADFDGYFNNRLFSDITKTQELVSGMRKGGIDVPRYFAPALLAPCKKDIAEVGFNAAGFSRHRQTYLLELFPKDASVLFTPEQTDRVVAALYVQYKSINDPANPVSRALEKSLVSLLGMKQSDVAAVKNKRNGFWFNLFYGGKKTADPVFELIELELDKPENADIKKHAKNIKHSAMAIMLSQSQFLEKDKIVMTPLSQPVKEVDKIDKEKTKHNFELLKEQVELESQKSSDPKLKCMIQLRDDMTDYLKAHPRYSLFHHTKQTRASYLDKRVMDLMSEYTDAQTQQDKNIDIVLKKLVIELLVHYDAILAVNGEKSELAGKLRIALTSLLEINPKSGREAIIGAALSFAKRDNAAPRELIDQIQKFKTSMEAWTNKEHIYGEDKVALAENFSKVGTDISDMFLSQKAAVRHEVSSAPPVRPRMRGRAQQE